MDYDRAYDHRLAASRMPSWLVSFQTTPQTFRPTCRRLRFGRVAADRRQRHQRGGEAGGGDVLQRSRRSNCLRLLHERGP